MKWILRISLLLVFFLFLEAKISHFCSEFLPKDIRQVTSLILNVVALLSGMALIDKLKS